MTNKEIVERYNIKYEYQDQYDFIKGTILKLKVKLRRLKRQKKNYFKILDSISSVSEIVNGVAIKEIIYSGGIYCISPVADDINRSAKIEQSIQFAYKYMLTIYHNNPDTEQVIGKDYTYTEVLNLAKKYVTTGEI